MAARTVDRMAKKATALARPSIIVVPSAPKRRGALRRRASGAVRAVRKHGRRGAKKAAPTTGLLVGALAVGYMQSKGWLNKIPTIGGSRALTLALAGYAATRFSTNTTVRTAGLAAMTAGAFDYGRIQGGGKSALEGDMDGDIDGDMDGEEF